ncbi:CHAT domain-containing protein [Streptomyces cylindrosporus]|uniref:CHAT domain-containing protein n=1 Tax=Streptomyces cylindrosporus TaxID=2927583 RepID=A0ABS9Y2P9_9ACTN|nr:CHAT domain-containing protein [Streptomyces cylindrosporus]MCI3271490.1 CHAT domain-containing protein [Streptomyces cylindrosporus]
MRDLLITALKHRVAQFNEQGDMAGLFEATASTEARELRALMVQKGSSGEAVLSLKALDTLVEFHFTRHRARAGTNGYADLGAALRLLTLRAQVRPEDIPHGFPAAVTAANKAAMEAGARAQQLMEEYHQAKDRRVLDEAVHNYRCELGLLVAADDVLALPMAHLSMALMMRFDLGKNQADLDEAIELREASIAYTAEEDPEWSRRLTLLSTLLAMRHEHAGQRSDLERAASVGRQAVRATPADSHARARRLAQLALILHNLYEVTDSLTHLQEAVEHAQEAVAAARPDDPDRLRHTVGLAKRLRARHDRLRDPSDLDTPVELLRSLLSTASEAQLPEIQTELATALYFRYERIGDLEDLDQAIVLERQAASATAGSEHARGRRLINLAVSLRVRHERLGSPDDLEEAIRLGTEAVPATGEDAFALSNLGLAFMLRYKRSFEATDLDRAIRLATRAVESFPDVAPSTDRAMAIAHLAGALGARLRQDFDLAGLDEVIKWEREAAATVPHSHPDYGRYLSSLSHELLRRFRHTESPDDLAEAMRAAERAVAVTPRSHPSYATLVGGLAQALTASPHASAGDVDRAVSLARDAVSAAPSDDVFLPRVWRRLGYSLNRRYEDRKDPVDLREAIQCWQHAVDLPTGTPGDRIQAFSAWGSAAVELADHALAAEGFGGASLLLPQLAWHGLPRLARETHLAEWSGLAPIAATCHILAGDPERAVEILEQGRTVIQNQLLHIRTDLSHLTERDPELAASLLRVREQLDAQGSVTPSDPTELPGEGLLSPLGRERLAQERAALCRSWDDLVEQARQLHGFEHFLAPIPYRDLSNAAGQGPVVVVNVSEMACHALVIRDAATPVEVVELPEVSHADVREQAQTFLNVLIARGDPHRPFLRREADRHAVFDIMNWLWARIAEPVLDRLGFDGAGDEALPRLWWCPTGLLTLLPLHAAGRYPRHRTAPGTERSETCSVPARVVPSYTSTLTALRRARENVVSDGVFGGILAVGMPETPGRPPLPGVDKEFEALRARFPPGTVRQLIGSEATREAVRQALHENAWAHFACHAGQDLMDPAQSAFTLHDARLTAAELLELDLPNAELAYLSACETAVGGVNLPDEVMNLASTLQLAGYRHVVATLWSIEDGTAAEMAARVYSELTRAARPNSAGIARALHSAVAAQRALDPTDPLRWAAYLHVGP